MLSVPAIYENGKITLLETIPNVHRARVIVTILEEWPMATSEAIDEPSPQSWLGALRHTLVGELGDLVSPIEENWQDWEVLSDELPA